MQLEARNADLSDLKAMLDMEQDLKLDAVVPPGSITSLGGLLTVEGLSALGDDLEFRPTEICDAHLADKLGIPLAYVRRMRAERVDLFDANVNGWLHGATFPDDPIDAAPDKRSFLLRTFSDPNGGVGIARALHSDRYGVVDNLDVLLAAMDGIRQAGVQVSYGSADLSERRMVVRFHAPSVAALAPTLLKGYRSPYSGNRGEDNPTVFAGFELGNSETGGGAFTITPRLVVEICTNGMKLTKDAFRKVHLGGKLEEGIVRYAEDTRRAQMELVTKEARDVVATFLDVDYVTRAIEGLEAKADKAVDKPQETVELIAKAQGYTQAEADAILNAFIDGGQRTAGGVLQAITYVAQQVESPDRAYELESTAIAAMELV